MLYKILLVEDDKKIREVIKKYLEKEGFLVVTACDGFDGLAQFNDHKPHLMILDVMMPGINGFEVLKQIREISEIPVIMLTAKYEESDRLKGFDLGVDDYVIKPFSPKELIKRVQVILKRSYTEILEKEIIIVQPFQLNVKQQKLFKDNVEIEITSSEFKVLEVFFSNVDRLLTREQLIEKAFGYNYEGFNRNIDSYIKKIRKKLEKNTRNPKYLKTKYGAGYIFKGDFNDN